MNLKVEPIILLSIILLVNCDFTTDWTDLQNNIAKQYSLNENQLVNKINSDLKFVDTAIDRRLSQTKELKIYTDLTLKFIKFYKEFRNEFERMLNKQIGDKKRKALLIRLATITTTMRYDEEWRAVNFKVSSNPLDTDQSLEEMQQKFRQLMLKLNNVLNINAEKNYFEKHIFWYHFYSRLSGFYVKTYIEADIEANKLNKTEAKVNLRVLIQELERFLYLLSLGNSPTKRLQNIKN